MDDYQLLNEYIEFCVKKIRDIFIALKKNIDNEKWNTYSSNTSVGLLTVTFINGILNVLRLLVANNKVGDIQNYTSQLEGVNNFDFKQYKSSQYRRMGQDIYNKFFQ